MQDRHIVLIAQHLSLSPQQVGETVALLNDDATVPFIARYRKEATGSLDEVAVADIRDRIHALRELDQRREAILKSLIERNLLTDELKTQIDAAETLTALEDIYLPYRPKRRTRAMIAREKGLEPLASVIFTQNEIDPEQEAGAFIDPEKGVVSVEEALSGARDIIAEWINEDQGARAEMRVFFEQKAVVRSRVVEGKETDGVKYRDYFMWEEPISLTPSHRLLAMRRGESEGFLVLTVAPPGPEAVARLERRFVKGHGPASEQVRMAVEDGYGRLLAPSMETETRTTAKQKADAEAIRVFADNLRELLLASPLGSKTVMAIDPGFRTGCKVVCLDPQGRMLHTDTVFPHTGERQRQTAEEKLVSLCARHGIEAVAIGNGTAGRETEAFVRALSLPGAPTVIVVNESGASVYSASEVARREFPDQDVTVRGAVSIGRRLMDPLAELVKIEPKAIGVGQYQHDVDQGELKKSLDDVVMSCVNRVGVELNTASAELLSYVSGVGPSLAGQIVAFRSEKGPFSSRQELLSVPRLGPKAFQQAAGFLRIHNAENPLDQSAVHPESYGVVRRMADDLSCSVQTLMQDENMREKVRLEQYVSGEIGLPTLNDIMAELARPGRDPRDQFEAIVFTEGVHTLEHVRVGMKMPGVVTNVTNFGAFVDIGVHHDGLVHISQLSDRYVKQPSDVVRVGQKVTATVLEVDLARQRISLSLRERPAPGETGRAEREMPSGDTVSPKRPEKPKAGHAPHPAREGNKTTPKTSVADLLKLNKGRL